MKLHYLLLMLLITCIVGIASDDTTPPPSISNINNTTTSNSINWTWTNPGGGDHNETVIWKVSALLKNVTNTTTYDLLSSLSENTAYLFSSKTKDAAGNLNATFVNQSATTNTSVTASFTKNISEGNTPLAVQFNDTSTGSSISSWNWSWGDTTWMNTTVSADRNATHTFTGYGNYTVFLIATNSCGNDQSDNQSVLVTANTTVIFYPDQDGCTIRNGIASFSTLRGGAGTSDTLGNAQVNCSRLTATSTSNQYQYMSRFAFTNNTSSIPDTATIESAKFGFYGYYKNSDFSGYTLELTGFAPDSYTAIDHPDHNNYVDGNLANSIAYADISTTGYNNFTLTDPTVINKTGYTGLMVRTGWDANNAAPTWGDTYSSIVGFYDSANSGTDHDPFLEVTYSEDDTTPPESITGLSNTTPACGMVVWNWTNPTSDFHHVYILKDNVFYQNLTTPTHTDTWTGLTAGNYTISIKTVDDAGNMNATWNNQTVYIDTTCPVNMGYLCNNLTYLNMTTYDGSGQLTHPFVLYNATAWNGYNYLMGMSPYKDGDDSYENPSVRYSNDMYTWEQISGQPDPIYTTPASGHYSDPNLVLNGSTLYMFYCHTNVATIINYTSTTDGISWTSPVTTDIVDVLSPSFIYNGTGWEAWVINSTSDELEHYESSNMVNWTLTNSTEVDLDGKTIWHGEVKRYDKQYQMLVVPTDYSGLYYFNSTNGIDWVSSEYNPVLENNIVGTWDDRLYKSSFIERNGVFDVFYPGWSSRAPYVWRVGYAVSPNGTCATPSVPVASFTKDATMIRIPKVLTVTNTSTNTTPTLWNWSWSDGTWTNGTTQNPTHQYTKRGSWSVFLLASNAFGSNTSQSQTVRDVGYDNQW